MKEPPQADWWSTYFDEHFVDLYSPLLPPEATREEAASVLEILGLSLDSDILDLGCGWGRYAIELARAGMRVTGADLSAPLLERAADLARSEGVRASWVRADMRDLAFDGEFDAVVSLFSSFGYFPSEDDDVKVLLGIRKALRPNGRLLIETMHRDEVAREFAERDWWEGVHGEHVWVEREFDAVAGVSREWLHWDGETGKGEKYHEIRIRSATEWSRLLESAGFQALEWFGDWDLSPFSHRSERLVILAARQDE